MRDLSLKMKKQWKILSCQPLDRLFQPAGFTYGLAIPLETPQEKTNIISCDIFLADLCESRSGHMNVKVLGLHNISTHLISKQDNIQVSFLSSPGRHVLLPPKVNELTGSDANDQGQQ